MPVAEDKWHVAHVFMSPFDEDCLYLKDISPQASFSSREKAIVHAHDLVNQEPIVEYGVIESSIPDNPCGLCWVCVHQRNIRSENLMLCHDCSEPLLSNYTFAFGKQLCNSCYRERDKVARENRNTQLERS
jgi:hypothetical protein